MPPSPRSTAGSPPPVRGWRAVHRPPGRHACRHACRHAWGGARCRPARRSRQGAARARRRPGRGSESGNRASRCSHASRFRRETRRSRQTSPRSSGSTRLLCGIRRTPPHNRSGPPASYTARKFHQPSHNLLYTIGESCLIWNEILNEIG